MHLFYNLYKFKKNMKKGKIPHKPSALLTFIKCLKYLLIFCTETCVIFKEN